MGTVIDFETGVAAPCECEDGYGLAHNDRILQTIYGLPAQPATPESEADPSNPQNSHPFPWVTAINDAHGFCFVRVQTGHESFIDVEVTKRQAATLISILANFLAAQQ